MPRKFLRRRIGAGWEVRLLQTGALPRPKSDPNGTDAAEQRAVDVASEVREDWTLDMRSGVVPPWRVFSDRRFADDWLMPETLH